MNVVEHILMKIAEESGEVAQAAAKCGVFGIFDSHPKYGDVPNIDLLITEANQLIAVVEMLGEHGIDVSKLGDRGQIANKKEKVKVWMDYARDKGTLT